MISSLDAEEIVTRCVRQLYRLCISTNFQYIVFILEIIVIERLINDFELKKELIEVLLMK